MSDLNLREASRETIVFTLKREGSDYNLAGQQVILRRRDGRNVLDSFSTDDVGPLLVVTDAAAGEVSFSPAADTWAGKAAKYYYELWFEVEAAATVFIAFPEATNINVNIVPGAV